MPASVRPAATAPAESIPAGLGLFLQDVEVVFEIQNLVSTAIAPLVAGDAPAVMLYLDQRRPHTRCHAQTRPQRRGIPVGLHLHAPLAVDQQRIQNLVNGKVLFGERR